LTAKAEATRQHIIACAASVFADNGYNQTRLTDIAEQAGLHLTALYYHYDNKDALARDLLLAASSARSHALRSALAELKAHTSVIARIAAVNRAYLDQILHPSSMMRASLSIMGEVSSKIREEVLSLMGADYEIWRALLLEGKRSGEIKATVDIDMVRMLLLGSMSWTVQWFDRDRGSPDRVVVALNQMLFEGIES
jgi:AcrR family transcriptional regulator